MTKESAKILHPLYTTMTKESVKILYPLHKIMTKESAKILDVFLKLLLFLLLNDRYFHFRIAHMNELLTVTQVMNLRSTNVITKQNFYRGRKFALFCFLSLNILFSVLFFVCNKSLVVSSLL